MGRKRARPERDEEEDEESQGGSDGLEGLDLDPEFEMDASFLLKMDRKALGRSRGEQKRLDREEKRQRGRMERRESPDPSVATSDSEQGESYEKVPRSLEKPVLDARLPTKSKSGQTIFPKPMARRPTPESSDQGESEEETDDSAPESPSEQDGILPADDIAAISHLVQEDPETNIMQINKIISYTHPSKETSTRILAMVSLLVLYIDIIPGYRVAHLTEKQKAENISKETKRIRHFEQSLLDSYTKYIRRLESALRDSEQLAMVGEQCMCTLLAQKSYFNCRLNLIHAVVGAMCRRQWNARVERCAQAVKSMFLADRDGVASLEVIRVMSKIIKDRKYQIHPHVLGVILSLRIQTADVRIKADESGASLSASEPMPQKRQKSGPGHLSKRAKKRKEEELQVEKELRQAEATLDREAFERQHTEVLKLIFVLFFRILKSQLVKPTPLLPVALDGLGKFAHMINVDFFKDILATLRQIIELAVAEDRPESARVILGTISSAFKLASGQGEALVIDLDDFTMQLYRLLVPLSLDPAIEEASQGLTQVSVRTRLPVSSLAHLLIDSLDRALLRVYPPPPLDRSAAFVRRLLITVFHLPARTSRQVVLIVRNVLAKHAKLESLLEHDPKEGVVAGSLVHQGAYRGDLDQPNLASAWGSTSFEVLGLALGTGPGFYRLGPHGHVSPGLQKQARALLDWRHPHRMQS